MPKFQIDSKMLTDNEINIQQLLVVSNLAPSKSEARRLLTQGGISINGEKTTDINHKITTDQLAKGIIIKKGKKVYKKIYI